jgi:sRNA-binding regulator protein Hfq
MRLSVVTVSQHLLNEFPMTKTMKNFDRFMIFAYNIMKTEKFS